MAPPSIRELVQKALPPQASVDEHVTYAVFLAIERNQSLLNEYQALKGNENLNSHIAQMTARLTGRHTYPKGKKKKVGGQAPKSSLIETYSRLRK